MIIWPVHITCPALGSLGLDPASILVVDGSAAPLHPGHRDREWDLKKKMDGEYGNRPLINFLFDRKKKRPRSVELNSSFKDVNSKAVERRGCSCECRPSSTTWHVSTAHSFSIKGRF